MKQLIGIITFGLLSLNQIAHAGTEVWCHQEGCTLIECAGTVCIDLGPVELADVAEHCKESSRGTWDCEN